MIKLVHMTLRKTDSRVTLEGSMSKKSEVKKVEEVEYLGVTITIQGKDVKKVDKRLAKESLAIEAM